MMIPFLESFGGNCQDAVILSEVVAARVKPLGGCEGTVIEKLHMTKKKMTVILTISNVIMIVIFSLFSLK